MKRLLALVAAIAAVTVMTEATASAQGFGNGYQFGAGFNQGFGNCGGFGFRATPREQPPYFAQFPPVYYSHIVKRPYGISPYAAPPGIAPVEMNYVAPEPVTVTNPFFGRKAEEAVAGEIPVVKPLKAKAESVPAESKPTMKTTWIRNPHYSVRVAQR